MESFEYCTGRLNALKEVRGLLSLIHSRDRTVAEQLKIIIDHCTEAANFEEKCINHTLELMELKELSGG